MRAHEALSINQPKGRHFEEILQTSGLRAHGQCHLNPITLSAGAALREHPGLARRAKRAAAPRMISNLRQAWRASALRHGPSARRAAGRRCRDASRWDVQAWRPIPGVTLATSEGAMVV